MLLLDRVELRLGLGEAVGAGRVRGGRHDDLTAESEHGVADALVIGGDEEGIQI